MCISCAYTKYTRSPSKRVRDVRKDSTWSLPKNVQISKTLKSRITLGNSPHCVNETVTQHPCPLTVTLYPQESTPGHGDGPHEWHHRNETKYSQSLTLLQDKSSPWLEALFSISQNRPFTYVYLSLSWLHFLPGCLPICPSPLYHCPPNLSSSETVEVAPSYLEDQKYHSPSSPHHVYNV